MADMLARMRGIPIEEARALVAEGATWRKWTLDEITAMDPLQIKDALWLCGEAGLEVPEIEIYYTEEWQGSPEQARARAWLFEAATDTRIKAYDERAKVRASWRHECSLMSSETVRGNVVLEYAPIADYFIKHNDPVAFNKEIWIYEDGLYREECGEIGALISKVARAVGFRKEITKVIKEVRAYVAAHHIERDYPFNQYQNALPLENGVLVIDFELGTAQLHPYTPEFMFTHRWPVHYDPDADAGPIEAAFAQYVDDDEIAALWQIPAQGILQFLGIGPWKRSYILEGPPDGGKSTYIAEFLNRIFGLQNIASASLQEIAAGERGGFVNGSLEGMVFNRKDDLSDVPVESVGQFKDLTGSFSHAIHRKFKQAYPGRITAVHVFATNAPPTFPDRVAFDPAFWSRWIYLKFNNSFERDPEFAKRTFTPAAISGAFNVILDTAIAIQRQRGLLFVQDPSEVRHEWTTAADPFKRFVSEEFKDDKDEHIFEKGPLFRAFLDWCQENEINPKKVPGTITAFTQMIYSAGFLTKRRGGKNSREYVYAARKRWKDGSTYEGREKLV